MQKLQFKCTLKSDVIISESSASEGQHTGLDFIPGGNFLGVAAQILYTGESEKTWTLFHSDKVRFGDAHPAYNIQGGLLRSLRIPADFYCPKLKKITDGEVYLNHAIPNPDSEEMKGKQLKQCRTGFYAFDGDKSYEVKVNQSYALKTAYETTKRRSEDEKIFGYESMGKGSQFLFDVEIDDGADYLADEIAKALCGDRHIGRSRSAQYGWAKIEKAEYPDTISFTGNGDGLSTVYADGRLIFFDANGMPTFQPIASDLGLSGDAEIVWEKSQIRTFHYAPWNFTRQAFDSERCGIEKGSVFVIKSNGSAPKGESHVGAYQNEGFGKVIYNPYFLDGSGGKDGKSPISFIKQDDDKAASGRHTQPGRAIQNGSNDSPLVKFLQKKKAALSQEKSVYKDVDDFANKIKDKFKGESFNSQWGTIRGIAMSTKNSSNIIGNIDKYLDHGVAKDKWEEGGRKKLLLDQLNKVKPEQLREFVINLASKMAKQNRENQ